MLLKYEEGFRHLAVLATRGRGGNVFNYGIAIPKHDMFGEEKRVGKLLIYLIQYPFHVVQVVRRRWKVVRQDGGVTLEFRRRKNGKWVFE